MVIQANPIQFQPLPSSPVNQQQQLQPNPVQFGHALLKVINTPHAPASPDFVDRIERGLDMFDPQLLKHLEKSGTEVVTGRSLIETFPEHTNRPKTGGRPGELWNSVDGLFRSAYTTNAGEQNGKIGVFEFSTRPIIPTPNTPPLPPPPPKAKELVIFDYENPQHMKTLKEQRPIPSIDIVNPERLTLFHARYDGDNPFVAYHHPNPLPILRHETGHALSYSAPLTSDVAQHSLSNDFIEHYLADLNTMPEEVKPALSYYIQPGDGTECTEQGWEEAFAESFAATQGSGCIRQDVMHTFFSNSVDYVQGILGKL